MTEVPDNLTYANMSPEHQAIVRMWHALFAPVQWRMDPTSPWHDEGNHAGILRVLCNPQNTPSNTPVWRSYYRLKPSE